MNYLNIIIIITTVFLTNCKQKIEQDNLDFQKLMQPIQGELDPKASISGFKSPNVFDSSDYFIWGASVVKGKDNRYHMFYARWPHGQIGRKHTEMDSIFGGMRGWLKYSEIAYAVSDNPAGPFRHIKTIFSGTGNKKDWNCYTAHNPHIKYFNGKYYLYYISNSFKDDFYIDSWNKKRNHWYKYCTGQRIGVIVANTLKDLINGKGRNIDKPLLHPDNKNTFHLVTNPSVTKGPDGKFYMMYKSWGEKTHPMTFWIAVADSPIGPFKLAGNVFKDAEFAAEDPYLWYDPLRERFYAIAKDFSHSGKLTPQKGALALITSRNGIDNWQPAKNSLISLRKINFQNGQETKLAHLERPQLLLDKNGQPQVLYAAASIKSPFAVPDPVGSNKPFHNTVNIHIKLEKYK